MNGYIPVEKVLFFDIETAPLYRRLEDAPPPLREYWIDKYDKLRPSTYQNLSQEEYFQERSGIHALFSRVVCISMGFFVRQNGQLLWRQVTCADLDERQILTEFSSKWNRVGELMREYNSNGERISYIVCGHNVLQFDIPFLGRRFILSRVEMPTFWRQAQRLPLWQLTDPAVMDTMQLWNFTGWDKSFISLEMLAYSVGLDFQKSLSHTEVRTYFWKWEDTKEAAYFEPVKAYCEEDVRTTARIFIRLQLPESKQKEYFDAINNATTV